MTNLFLAIGAFALGLTAQSYFGVLERAPTPVDGLLVYAVAASLFVVAVLRTSRLPGLSFHFKLAAQRLDARRSAWSIFLLLLAGIAIALSLTLFGNDVASSLSWLLYLSAIWLFVVAVHSMAPPLSWGDAKARTSGTVESVRNPSSIRIDWLLLLAILIVGALFRLYRFTELPYGLWYDEADNGLWARRILTDPNFRPIYVPSTNLPAHFLFLVALAFRLLGDSMHAIRAVAVLFGMLTIVAAYFCGRELFDRVKGADWLPQPGRYYGLILAFLLAVSRWDVNWSRIGMHGVTLPFFELWVVAALLRALRTGRLTSFAWTGVALGLGLCFYSPFRIFPVVLVGFALVWFGGWLNRAWRENPHWSGVKRVGYVFGTWGMPVLLLTMGALIAVAPVIQFALRRPEVFWDRAKRVSVFKDPNVQARPVAAILESTVKHLLMFNYRGDSNGRHNLPGAPMLDRISAVLLVLGVVICIVRWHEPRSILLLLWLLVPLVGGVLSTWFEAPQSLRSIGSLPAAYALICLSMEWFAAEWRRVFPKVRANLVRPKVRADLVRPKVRANLVRPKVRANLVRPKVRANLARRPSLKRPLTMVAMCVLLAIGLENAVTYFYFWGHDFASWAAFNPAETHMARDIDRYRNDYDLRFDPLLTAHLATRYLLPDYPVYHHFDPATVFPIRGADKSGVLLFIAPDTYVVREQARGLYPGVQIETFAHPYGGNVVLHKYFFTQDVITAVQGLDARYMSLQAGKVDAHSRVDAEIDFGWADHPPYAYPFQATWAGGLLAFEYGVYTLQVDVPGECALELDGRVVLQGTGSQRKQIAMARGVHALYVDCRIAGPGQVGLLWTTPGDASLRPVPHDALYRLSWPVRGLVSRFYPNADWAGEPAFVRIDRQVAYYFHFLPLPRPYTVEWIGRLAAPVSGTYRLGVRAISSASLYVDDRPIVGDTPVGRFVDGEVYLDSGLHDIRVRYLDDRPHSQVYLYWQVPGGAVELIPPDALFLPQEGAWWPVPHLVKRAQNEIARVSSQTYREPIRRTRPSRPGCSLDR